MLFMRKNIRNNGKEDFGQRLCRLRKCKGMTQGELGERIGVSIRALSGYERGECEPSVHLLAPLAENLGVDVAELLGVTPCSGRSIATLNQRWAKRFKEIENLSGRKQHAIMQVLDMALQKG